jgi:hypothetical protein
LQQLPDTIGQLTALGSLDLLMCSSLQQLPDTFGQLTALTRLSIAYCKTLQYLPAGMHLLKGIGKLDKRGCSGVVAEGDYWWYGYC